MSPTERDLEWEFWERWLSGPPQAPPQLGPVQRLLRWCRKRPLLAATLAVSILGLVGIWGISIWGWVQSARTIGQLRTDLLSAQQQIARSEQLLEDQKQQLAHQTQRLREMETAAHQAQRQYHQAHQEMEQLNTRCQNLQSQNAHLQQELQIARAWQLARQAQDWVFVEPHRSLLLATEAVRIFLDQGIQPELGLEQTLQDALAQMGQGRLEGQPPEISALALSRDGRWLITASEDGTVRVWNMQGKQPTLTGLLRTHTGTVYHILFTPDPSRFITAGHDGQLLLWDLDTSGPSRSPLRIGTAQGPIRTAALSADGRWLLTAAGSPFQKEYPAYLWDLHAQPPGSRSVLLRGHELPIRSVAFSADLRWAVTAGEDRTIRLYHLQAKYPAAEQRILTGHEKAVVRVAISPNSRWLVSASTDGTVRLWDLQAPEAANGSMLLPGPADSVEALAIDAGSRWLAAGSADGVIRLWDLQAPNPAPSPRLLKGHERPIHCLAFTPDGHRLLSGSADGTLRIWDLTASDPNEKPLILRSHSRRVRLMSLSEDRRLLVTASESTPDTRQAVVRFWHLQPEDVFQEAKRIVAEKFTPTEQQEILASLRPFASTTR